MYDVRLLTSVMRNTIMGTFFEFVKTTVVFLKTIKCSLFSLENKTRVTPGSGYDSPNVVVLLGYSLLTGKNCTLLT